MLVACSEDDFMAHKSDSHFEETFSYRTTKDVELYIDYGRLAGSALVQLYSEDPLAGATSGSDEPKGETVFTTFLDGNGHFAGVVEIPAHVKEIYAYSPSWGAPYIVHSDLKDDVAQLRTVKSSERSAVRRKAEGTEQLTGVRRLYPAETGNGNISNLWTISDGWNVYGKSNDANHLEDEGHLTNQDILDLQNFLWQGKTSKPSATDDRKAFINGLKTDKANIIIVNEYDDPETGEKVEVKSAELWFTFVNEYAWNENVMGYYYYPEGTTPTKDNLKLFVCVPNASVANNAPFGTPNTYGLHNNDDAPVKTSHRVQLLYMDNDGNVSKDFPPGTDVGFFTIVDGFHAGSEYGTETTIVNGKSYKTTRTKGGISTAAKRYYSNKEFNDGGTAHYIAVRMADGTIVYGVEDGSDNSFDDVLFTITASPNLAMHPETGDVPMVPQEHVQQKYTTDKSKKFTYLFEDIWPSGGDYDLNDVVVRHSREITYNQLNYVSEVKEFFTFEETPTTRYNDAFAFVIPEEHKSEELILPAGAVFEKETNSVFVTTSARNLYGQTVTVVRKGFTGVRKDDILNEFINPYIVNQTTGPGWNQNNRVEIHMADGDRAKVTSKALVVDHPFLSIFVDQSGKYPYAISIPNTTFVPCDELKRIGSEGNYPNFIEWTESKGNKYTDWYKNKQ